MSYTSSTRLVRIDAVRSLCAPATTNTHCAGIFQVDPLLAVRREYGLAVYKLDAVARHFLADNKVDLSPKAMMALWREGTPEAKARIGAYCLQDTSLPLRLADRLDVFSSLFEMANATYVPCDFILQRGQTIKCFSLLVHAMHKCGLLAPAEIHEQGIDGGYVGATLLEPRRGAYFQPCGVCDFASLVRHLARSPAYVVMLRLLSGVAVLTSLRVAFPRLAIVSGTPPTLSTSVQQDVGRGTWWLELELAADCDVKV